MTFINEQDKMQDNINALRCLNYELVKELGLFKRRAGLSFAQRHILFHIKNNNSLSIQNLAEMMYVEHSTMSRNIKKLIHEELVEVFQDECDKRRKVVALSAKGEKNLAEATESINQTLSRILDVLDVLEIEGIIESVRKYSHALKANN